MHTLVRGWLFFLALISFPAWGALDIVTTPPDTGDSHQGHSIAPVVGYEPVYGLVVGGAYFYEQEETAFGIDANLNFRDVYQVHTHITQVFDEWQIKFKTGVTQGFDPYYGEGGETDVNLYKRLWGIKWDNRLYLTRRIGPIFTLGGFTDFRLRTETAARNEVAFNRQFPDEKTAAVGVTLIFDTRKKRGDSQDAFMWMTNLSYAPPFLTDDPDSKGFGQVESSFIVYKEMMKELLPDVVAAFRVMGGYTFGTPTYNFKFRLGGANELPGYFDNRFRGSKYYMQQTEVRIPVWGMLGLALFLGFGDATDDSFTNAKMAYGGGLRIGLPPDYVSKIRIDCGFGRDQWGVFANFGVPF